MKKFSLLTFFGIASILWSLTASGQTDTIKGNVYYKHYTNFIAGIVVPYYFKDSVTIQLKQGNAVMYQTMVTPAGKYVFTGVAPGAYTLTAVSTKTWGGGNATDGLTILRNFVGIPPLLSGLNWIAGDVNNDGVVNATDALLVSWAFITGNPLFPTWAFEQFTVTITANTILSQNIFGLCKGDVNGSYIPLNMSLATP